jgi:hypothetical protein
MANRSRAMANRSRLGAATGSWRNHGNRPGRARHAGLRTAAYVQICATRTVVSPTVPVGLGGARATRMTGLPHAPGPRSRMTKALGPPW